MDLVTYFQQLVAPYVRARLARDEAGASLVEYALLVGLIAIVCVGAVTFLGNSTKGKFSSIGSLIQ